MQFKGPLMAGLAALVLAGCATAARPVAGNGGDRALDRALAGRSFAEGSELERLLAAAAQHPLGSRDNPVRAAMPVGERAYLARLRCADGRAPQYARAGNLGIGPFGNIIDLYQVTCAGSAPNEVVMDMYHPNHVEARPVPGFTIVNP